jgi:hypothetical protein
VTPPAPALPAVEEEDGGAAEITPVAHSLSLSSLNADIQTLSAEMGSRTHLFTSGF